MKTAVFIPVKERSERVKRKNFKVFDGEKLYERIINKAINSLAFNSIYVDTDSKEIKEKYKNNKQINIIDRKDNLSLNSANGNDLLSYHFELFPDYDYYFQLFATSPFIKEDTIKFCVDSLIKHSKEYDSIFTAIKKYGFYWLGKNPINYQPAVLPRSQDLKYIIEETTALYGIKKLSLKRFRCRIGSNPYIKFVDTKESIDINTEEDFNLARFFLTQK